MKASLRSVCSVGRRLAVRAWPSHSSVNNQQVKQQGCKQTKPRCADNIDKLKGAGGRHKELGGHCPVCVEEVSPWRYLRVGISCHTPSCVRKQAIAKHIIT